MNRLCEECKNFIQHYHTLDGKPQKVYCGHCRENKNHKLIAPNQTKCELFAKIDNRENIVETKNSIKEINTIIHKLRSIQETFIEYVENNEV